MTSLATSLNASLAAGEAARLMAAQQARAMDDAGYLRAALMRQGVPVNGRIIASYAFAVGSDGSFIPTEAHITAQTDTGDRGSHASQQTTTVSLSLGSISRPRTQLTPSDELAIFSVGFTSVAAAATQAPSAAIRAQQEATSLYARNGDMVYTVNPLINEAA